MISKLLMCVGLACSASLYAQTVPNNFDKNADIFIAQYDSIPDPDDIHSQAAVGSLLAHPDMSGVNYFAVAGAYGEQIVDRNNYIVSAALFNLAFGPEALPSDTSAQRAAARWVDAHGGSGGSASYPQDPTTGYYSRPQERVDNMDFACDVIIERVKPILQAGGRVFVMEAGQSDLTAEWVERLMIEEGITNTSTNVILVQHSFWNERHTPGNPHNPVIFDDGKNDWDFITNPNNLTYWQIDDGNFDYGDTSIAIRTRGDNTPNFKASDATFLTEATSATNPNDHSRQLWTIARDIITDHLGGGNSWPHFRSGYIDFSDAVEAMWIFDLAHESAGLTNVADFWDSFVTNVPSVVEPEEGLIAHWSMDEATGNTVSDISGNNYDATLLGGSWNNDGARGTSLEFQSSSSGVALPSSAFASIDQEVTVSLWVEGADNQPLADTVFRGFNTSGNRVLNIHLPWSNSKIFWDAGNSGASYDRLSKTASASQYEGGWNHWVFTKNATTGIMSAYVNGALFATSTGNTHDMTGVSSAVFGDGYNGSIDELMLFNYELSASEVLELYESQADLGVLFSATDFDAESHPNNENIVRNQGTNVGYIKDGSWIRFDAFNFGTGVDSIEISASSFTSGGTIEIRTGSSVGALVGSIAVSNTSGWDAYQTFVADLNTIVSGVDDLYFVFTGGNGGLMNVSTFLFDLSSGSSVVISRDATSYDLESHPSNENIVRDQGTNVGYIKNGSWVMYSGLDFGAGVSSISVSAASARNGGTIEVRKESSTGPLISSVPVSNTGSWTDYQTFSGNINSSVSGGQDLYFVFTGGSGFLMDIKSFEID